MKPLDFDTLRDENSKRCVRWHPPNSEPWSLADWSNAMCGEAGEAANVVKKIRRIETGSVQRMQTMQMPELDKLEDKLADELADLIIYADILAAKVGIDLSIAIRRKFNRVSEELGFPERL